MSEHIQGLPLGPPPMEPLPATIVIPVRKLASGGVEVLWVQRARGLTFAGGFHALPGGRVDAADATIPVKGSSDADRAFQAAAVRELIEETGLAVAIEPLPLPEQTRALRVALRTQTTTLQAWLEARGQFIHAGRLLPAGRWVTPESFATRFDARLYLVEVAGSAATSPPVPDGQELTMAEWITPRRALGLWAAGSALLHAPVLHVLEVLSEFRSLEASAKALAAPRGALNFISERLEYQRGIRAFPLKTATLPPASHTNAYVLGQGELLLVDPGTDDKAECERLFAYLAVLEKQGLKPTAIVLTHRHGDHVSGAQRVQQQLGLPILCHRITAQQLSFPADGLLEDGDVLKLSGAVPMRWRILHTPGHAQGHLCLMDEASQALIAGDMVSGLGTILIDPPEGDMGEYLRQLERLRHWPVGTIYPAHGPPMPGGPEVLGALLDHRRTRERQVMQALIDGRRTLPEIARAAYAELPAEAAPLTERSTRAILMLMIEEGQVSENAAGFRPRSDE